MQLKAKGDVGVIWLLSKWSYPSSDLEKNKGDNFLAPLIRYICTKEDSIINRDLQVPEKVLLILL